MIDKDNSHTIELNEFRDFFRQMKIEIDEGELLSIFSEIDENGSRTIDFNEFQNRMKMIIAKFEDR